MKKSILFGERVQKTKDNEFGWNTLYDSKKKNPKIKDENLLGKKSIIFFPGDGSNSEKTANACCKAVQGMLMQAGISPKNMPHFYALAYQGGEQDKHRYQILTQLKQAQFGAEYVPENSTDTPYYQPFFDEYILPLIVDEKGKPRSPDEIRKNIQNVTFATHCHGGFVAYQIEKMMAEKLAEFYPKQMPDLMRNVRMIHFSSRRPQGQNSYGKHFDIISQNDDMFADEAYLEYDNIHRQIHRSALSTPSVLVRITPNEEILLFKKLTTGISEDVNQDADHSQILQIFSGEFKSIFSESTPAIQTTRQLLRHFVEHPDDKKNLEDQLKEINPDFVAKNSERGKTFLTKEKKEEKIRRGLLSFISTWEDRWGAHRDRRERIYRRNGTIYSAKTYRKNVFLRQRDDEGNFLYDQLKKNYLATENSSSLIHFIQDIGPAFLPEKEREELLLRAVQNNDWQFFNAIGGVRGCLFGQIKKEAILPIISSVETSDLYRLFPFLKSNSINLSSDAIKLLMSKIKKVKNVTHQRWLSSFLEKATRNLNASNLKKLLKQSSMKGRKIIKSWVSEKRQAQASELISIMRERDQVARGTGLTIKEARDFKTGAQALNWGASLTDLLQFKSAQKDNKNLTFDKFMMERRKSK